MSRFDRLIELGVSYPAQAFRKGKHKPLTMEGGGGGDAPSPPDPWATSQAQYTYGTKAAAYNKALNLGDYSNPFGGQKSVQVGTDPNTGAPIYQTNITAAPQFQGMLNQDIGQAGNFAGQINPGGVADASQRGQQAYYDQQAAYLDPQFKQQGDALDAQLAAQGIMPGSQAWQNEKNQFARDKTLAYQQARDSAITMGQTYGLNQLNAQDALASSAQNRLGALASMLPGYTGTGSAGVQAPDFAGAAQNAYQGQMNAYNQNQATANSNRQATYGAAASVAMIAAMAF